MNPLHLPRNPCFYPTHNNWPPMFFHLTHRLALSLCFIVSLSTARTLPLPIPLNLTQSLGLPFYHTLRNPELTLRRILAYAVRSIQQDHPHAQLTKIQCTSPIGPTVSPTALTDIRLFFRNSRSPTSRSTIVLCSAPHATAWGEWSEPQYLPEPRPDTELGLGDILASDIMQTWQ